MTAPTQTAGTTLLIDRRELAALLGLSVRSVELMAKSGRLGLREIRLGNGNRAIRYCRDEATAWVRAGCPDAAAWASMREAGGRQQ